MHGRVAYLVFQKILFSSCSKGLQGILLFFSIRLFCRTLLHRIFEHLVSSDERGRRGEQVLGSKHYEGIPKKPIYRQCLVPTLLRGNEVDHNESRVDLTLILNFLSLRRRICYGRFTVKSHLRYSINVDCKRSSSGAQCWLLFHFTPAYCSCG